MEYGCIGEHLTHSFSKEIHKCLADYEYEIKEIPKEELDSFMQAADFKAINVTIPYKQAVIPHLFWVSDTAKKIGAVNTIVNRNGKLYGYNTDFYGMTSLINENGITITGKKVLVLGSGGTSKTAVCVAEGLGAREIQVVSRTSGEGVITYQEAYKNHRNAEIIINTTGVIDAIYNPLRSRLVLDAEVLGIKAVGGLYMLVAQAAKASEKFIGTALNTEKTKAVYETLLAAKQNIVLTGMPACGKSTIGEKLSVLTGKPFIDTDSLIAEKAGKSIPEIFEEAGEIGFRTLEAEVIAEISPLGGYVIATGGGAILNPQNVLNLKANGRIYYIDRPLSWLTATKDRPLSSNRADLEKRYSERYEIYKSTADVVISAVEDLKENVDMILKSEGK